MAYAPFNLRPNSNIKFIKNSILICVFFFSGKITRDKNWALRRTVSRAGIGGHKNKNKVAVIT